MIERHKLTLLALAVFFLPFALYLNTLCPGIYPGDGPELTAAAYVLGIPHPTGYSLYMILGYLFTHLGLGSPAFSMNLFSALFGGVACTTVYLFQARLWAVLQDEETANRFSTRFCMAAVSLTLGASSTWWDMANLVDVMTPMLTLVSGAWMLSISILQKPTRKKLLWLCVLSAAGFLHHQIFLVTLPTSFVALLAVARSIAAETEPNIAPRGFFRHLPLLLRGAVLRRLLPPMLLCFWLPWLAGLSYLPIRAAALPPVNSGDPSTPSKLFQYISGGQFRGTRVLTEQRPDGLHKVTLDELPAFALKSVARVAQWMGEQITPGEADEKQGGNGIAVVLLALAVFGFIALAGKSNLLAWGLGWSFLLDLGVAIVYTIADIAPYQLPMWMLVCCLAPVGIVLGPGLFLELTGDKNKAGWIQGVDKRALVAGVVFVALSLFAVLNWYAPGLGVNKAKSTDARDFVEAAFKVLPPNATLFTGGDYDIYPLWYGQACERLRPDVAVVGSNFVFSRWYNAMLRASLPKGVSVFIGDEPPSTQARWLIAFLGGMVVPQLEAGRPVYLTSLLSPDDLRLIAERFELKPKFQLPCPLPDEIVRKIGRKMPLVLYELTDPKNSAAEVKRVFEQNFPHAGAFMTRRTKN